MIGIDQSYADTGITVSIDGKVVLVRDCKGESKEPHTSFRLRLVKCLSKCFASCYKKSCDLEDCKIICIIERIRLQSGKPDRKQHFLSLDYIKSIGALNAIIVDTAAKFNIPVFSVDTRSWKSRVIGTSKPGPNPYGFPEEKWPTIKWCIARGFEDDLIESVSLRKKKAVVEKEGRRFTYNDNKADSIGISLYGFLPSYIQKLEEER